MYPLSFWCVSLTHHSYLHESVSEDDIAILAWGHNHMHDKAAVHKDEWEEFFQHFHRLQQGNFWKSKGRVVDWDRYIGTAHTYKCSVYMYAPQMLCICVCTRIVVCMCTHFNTSCIMTDTTLFSLFSLKPTSSMLISAQKCANICTTTSLCWGNSWTLVRRQDGDRVSIHKP